ncbi:DUF559 domain-containing protein [Metallibacterium sp.]|uniref:DUF559 domain-containing protein n=1 Tax=Metallibacterium sp. TaxID=2940281 RepID=UPI002625F21F|nr:DUF559 domain-containing protein [Metallibacterium sp.]
MAGEWTLINLDDVCSKIGSGATPRGGSDVYLESGPYALIRSQNVYNDGFHHDGLAYIDEKHAAELDGVEVLKGDVLLNITGDSVARACQVDPSVLPARVNQHVAIIRPDSDKLDPRFLRYFLVSPEMQVKLLSWAGSGGTRNALTKGMIESVGVLAPEDITEQRAIAHILGTLDDKIELNRRMSETLEAMARTLFKAWFVDFEPVRAKHARSKVEGMEGRWQRGSPLHSPLPAGEGSGVRAALTDRAAVTVSLPADLRDFARELRRRTTDAEALLWRLLRNRHMAGAKFRRQHPLSPYVLDFYCHDAGLAVELDGGQHNEAAGRRHDARRDAFLAQKGIRVLRFWNHEVLNQTEAVLEAIYAAVGQASSRVEPSPPAPLPAGEGSFHLPAHLYDLFPDRLVDSELGEIPEGWEVRSLDQIARFLNGLALQKFPPNGEHSLPVIKIAQLRAGNTIGADRASSNLECDYIIQDGDILFSWSGSLECVLWAGGPGALNQHLFKVASETYPKWFCYLGIHLHLDDFRRIAAGKATTMGHIQRHHLTDAKLVVPPTALLRAADVVMAPIIGDIWRLSVQSRTLAALRDTLLPKLISGELRAQNAGCFTRRGV